MQWSPEDWISRGPKKRFQHCLNPNSSRHFLYVTAIQGHSGGNAIDPELRDNVLLSEGFTEYIYHVGHASEMNSIIRNGLIPGGRGLNRGRQSVFFTVVYPMEDDNGMVETPCNLTKPRIAPHKKYLETPSTTVYFGAIYSSLRREDHNFTKHGDMQLFSKTHSPPFALRKRYARKRRRSSSKRYALLQDFHGLYSQRIRTAVNKINLTKTQDHLGTNPANRRVPGKPGTTPWITEFLAYPFPQSNSRTIQHVKTRSRS